MGKNLRTKTFQSLLEAIHVLQSDEEVHILQCIEFIPVYSIYIRVCMFACMRVYAGEQGSSSGGHRCGWCDI